VTSTQKVLPIASVLTGALIWGLVWYPYRVLQNAGVDGLLATFLTYLLALLCSLFMLPQVWRESRMFGQRGAGWWAVGLMLSAGWSNLGYVLAILHGEVMRVVLLFYLAPLWTILFSYWLLGEQLNRYGYMIIALSISGATVMLWDPHLGVPLPGNLAEWIGLSAGMSFALSNVVSRRAAQLSVKAKSFSILSGTVLLTAVLTLWQGGLPGRLMAIGAQTWLILVLLGVVICAISFTVQYALAHLPANRAIILFLFELVVAAFSSYLLAGEAMHLREWAGALLIVLASVLSGKLYAQRT